MVAHSDRDEVAAVLARSRLRVWVVACGVSVMVIVAILVAQLVGPGGAAPSAVGAVLPLPWFVGALLFAGRPSRPPRFTDKQLQALTMTLSFIAIYLIQAGLHVGDHGRVHDRRILGRGARLGAPVLPMAAQTPPVAHP